APSTGSPSTSPDPGFPRLAAQATRNPRVLLTSRWALADWPLRRRGFRGFCSPVGGFDVEGSAGLGESEVALGDVVAVDLAGAAVDRRDGCVPGVVVDPPVGGRALGPEPEQALGARHLLEPA